jgi:hypothetical protein
MSKGGWEELNQTTLNTIFRVKTPRRKEKDLLISPNLACFALRYVKVFGAYANFPVACGYPKRGFPRAKTPRTPSPEV